MLIAEQGAALPDLCLYSGKPTRGQRVTKKLVWAPPTLAILLLISPLIYLVAYFIVRKTAALEYSLSKKARKRRASGIMIALGGFALSIVLFMVAAAERSSPVLIAALVLMVAALLVGLIRSQLIRVVKIDATHVRLRLSPEAARAFAAAVEG
jgi:hypothetical protein